MWMYPAYSPYLVPLHCHLLGSLKESLGGHHYMKTKHCSTPYTRCCTRRKQLVLRKQLCMDMTVITQLYYQLYMTCQLHVSANTTFGHHRVGYNYRTKLHNMIWYSITISVGVSRGDEISFKNELEGVCAEGLICVSIHVMLRPWFHKDCHYCWRYQWGVVGLRGKPAGIVAL